MRFAGALCATAIVCACGPLPDGGPQRQAITDGTLDPGHPSVGLLLVPTASGKMGQCTATLVGERTVLTAAHCLTFHGTYLFQLDRAQHLVQRVVPHPGYDWELPEIPPDHDIGLALLETAPAEKPSAVSIDPPRPGSAIVLVGFGVTAEGAGDGGIKRRADNVIEQVQPARFGVVGSGNGVGNLCHGDSGGPAFVVARGQELVAGVTSAAEGGCGTSRSWETRVDAYLDWIQTAAAGDLILPDSTPPRVSIVSPESGATVRPDLTVEATVSDESEVAQVGLEVDGAPAGTLGVPPYRFVVKLSPGPHELAVWAIDAPGHRGRASTQVTVVSGDLLAGQSCTHDLECRSEICFDDEDGAFCTEPCTQGSCPEGLSCRVPQDGGQALCLRQIPTGGCSVARQLPGAPPAWILALPLFLLAARRVCPARSKEAPRRARPDA